MWKRTGNVREEEFDRENKRRGEYGTAERQTMREGGAQLVQSTKSTDLIEEYIFSINSFHNKVLQNALYMS